MREKRESTERRSFSEWSLPVQLMVFLFLPLLAVLGGLSWYGIGQIGTAMKDRLQEDVELIARSLQESIGYSMEREREGSIQQTMEAAFEFGRVYGAYLYDNDGHMIAQAGKLTDGSQNEVRRMGLLDDRQPQGLYATMEGEPLYSYFVPIRGQEGQPLGLLQVARHQDEIQSSMLQMKRKLLLFLLLAGVSLSTVLLVGYYLALGRSLPELHRTMLLVRQGKRQVRATAKGPREIAELARSFNATLDALDRKQAEIQRRREEEKRLRERLIRSEKLAALGEVSGAIAHEIGTPLATIDGKAQRGLRNNIPPETYPNLFRDIREEVTRLEKFIQRLVTFGREESSQRRNVPVRQLWKSAATAAAETVGWCQTLTCANADAGVGEDTVEVDPVRMELALKNLLQNAIQAAGPEGTVLYGWRKKGEGLEIYVVDDGPGIPDEVSSRIWEPFHSSKGDTSGMGLGLALVSRIVDQHGGQVFSKNVDSGGAEFTLYLPPPILST